MFTIYDEIGLKYSVRRRTDPGIARQLHMELIGATRILNIGAGAGSYEPEHVSLIAVEPSSEMIAQRKADAHPVTKAFAEALPFKDGSFSHVMTVLSMHHWGNRKAAFSEISRVATEKFVAVTWDPSFRPFWLVRDYFPEIYEIDTSIFPDLEEISEHFDDVKISTLLISDDCADGFLGAYWKRPEAYLSSEVRRSISSFSRISKLSEGLRRLAADVESGAWAKLNQDILDKSSLDVGYRIVAARLKSA